MALSMIGKYQNLSILSRLKVEVTSLGKIKQSNQTRIKSLHISRVFRYPEAPALPLPTNISEIFANDTGRFTPERARDITAPVLLYSSSNHKQFSAGSKGSRASFDVNNSYWINSSQQDSHVDSYDCFGAVSLNSSMQTNVPKPFNSTGKCTYLNMPGVIISNPAAFLNSIFQQNYVRNYSTSSNAMKGPENDASKTEKPKVIISKKERFQIMVKDYGKTLTVFHIGISLMSLGACYAAVSSGVDISKVANVLTENNNEVVKKIMVNSSTFAVAYGVHKLLAPLRLAITMTVVPFLVRYLRRKGILKHPEIAKKLREAKLKASGAG